MNCNCCNCSKNNNNSCGEDSSKIKIYGQLVNVTLDNSLDDANCAADNLDYATGHNDALAYAYQLHDGRFRADDENLPAHERFQDAINRRVTNISYDPTTNTTTIEGNVNITGVSGGDTYDDAWLKAIIGTTPAGQPTSSALLQSDFTEESGDIITYIRLLKQHICALEEQVAALQNALDTNTCLWKVDTDQYLAPNCNCRGVKGNGFYDTTVTV